MARQRLYPEGEGKTLAVMISTEQFDKLREKAFLQGTNISDLIRPLIDDYLKDYQTVLADRVREADKDKAHPVLVNGNGSSYEEQSFANS